MTTGTTAVVQKSIHIGQDEAAQFGTTGKEFKLWVDYIFDWFGASLERPFRRYLVAGGFASVVWIAGALIVLPFGLLITYLSTPGVYYFFVGIAWCMNSLRWLSQVYHVRTNYVRPCFPIPDEQYRQLVTPYARRATRNWRIFGLSAMEMIPIYGYFAAVLFRPTFLDSVPIAHMLLARGFPGAFPPIWRTGSNLVPKLVTLDWFFTVAFVCAYTGYHITFATAPLYGKLSTIPIVPLPNLITERFNGVLRLYLSGAFMWSFGIVLAELLYEARLDILGAGFVIAVITFGILAYTLPRRAIRKIWHKAKDGAVTVILEHFYEHDPLTPSTTDLSETESSLQAIIQSEPAKLDAALALDLVSGLLLPVIPLLLNTYFPHVIGFR